PPLGVVVHKEPLLLHRQLQGVVCHCHRVKNPKIYFLGNSTLMDNVIIKEVQEEQKRELRIVQEREIKEMKAQQTKASIESSRSVMNDPKLRNKAERDRRIRELNDYNTKRFIDQRKFQAQKHEKQSQELNKRHAQEEQDVISAMKKERDEFIRKYEEDLLAVKRSTVI
ncbi:unnamed protein product, partial [Dicrocoelium dendriticum]